MGLMHIYCGDGKGKTTASIGLAIRAVGAGLRVCFLQFMKGGATAELNTLKNIRGITVMRCDRQYPFFSDMSETEKSEITACHDRLLEEAFSGGFDMIVLDEFNCAYRFGLMDCRRAKELLLNGRNSAEIVLTGRDPDEELVDMADYVSRIECVKHPYDRGVPARKGIEF